MKVKSFPLILSPLLLFMSCNKNDDEGRVFGCTNEYATNYDATATWECNCCEFKQGDVIVWADSLSFISSCGEKLPIILVDTKTGIATENIIWSTVKPLNCDSTQPGHIRVNVGSYEVRMNTEGYDCDTEAEGWLMDQYITIEEGCNIIRLQ